MINGKASQVWILPSFQEDSKQSGSSLFPIALILYKPPPTDIHKTDEHLPDHFSGFHESSLFIDVLFDHQVAVGVVGWVEVSDHSAGNAEGSGN